MEINQIICEDCISGMKKMEKDSVAISITSPPYRAGVDISSGKKSKYDIYKDDLSDDEYYKLIKESLTEAIRVSKYYVFMNFQILSGTKKVWNQIMWDFKDNIKEYFVWAKTCSQPAICDCVVSSGFEFIICFTKPEMATKRKFEYCFWDNREKGARVVSNTLIYPPNFGNRTENLACLTPDTEILTIEGWKNYKELDCEKGTKIASYNIETGKIEYERLSYLHELDFEGNLVQITNKRLDILMTPDHRSVIKRKGKEMIVLADQISKKDKIRIAADFDYTVMGSIGESFAELVGWIISEGHFIKSEYNGKQYSPNTIGIFQNRGKKSKRIEDLIKKLEIPYSKRKHGKGYDFYLKKSPLIEWVLKNIPDKQLNRFLVSLPKNEIKRLFEGLVLGDGHIRKDGRICFSQKNKKTTDWFQILALRLGYSAIITKRKNINVVYLNNKDWIGILTNKNKSIIKSKFYKGKVWCPTVRKNYTFVARRNGKPFITGNCFPTWLPEFFIKNFTREGDTVLDFFAGTCTTAKVAKRMGRNYLGFEISQGYIDKANKELSDIMAKGEGLDKYM